MSNLFKYTKRVLTSVLAAAVVLTAIPSTAFGAEIVDEDIEVVTLQEDAQEAESAEETPAVEEELTVDGTFGVDEGIVEEEEDTDPDKSANDTIVWAATVTGDGTTGAKATEFKFWDASTDSATLISNNTGSVSVTLDQFVDSTGARRTSGADSDDIAVFADGDSANDYSFYVTTTEGHPWGTDPKAQIAKAWYIDYTSVSETDVTAASTFIAKAIKANDANVVDVTSSLTCTKTDFSDGAVLVTVPQSVMNAVSTKSAYTKDDHTTGYAKPVLVIQFKDNDGAKKAVPITYTVAADKNPNKTLNPTQRTVTYDTFTASSTDHTSKHIDGISATLKTEAQARLSEKSIKVTYTPNDGDAVTYTKVQNAANKIENDDVVSDKESKLVAFASDNIYLSQKLVNDFVLGKADLAIEIDTTESKEGKFPLTAVVDSTYAKIGATATTALPATIDTTLATGQDWTFYAALNTDTPNLKGTRNIVVKAKEKNDDVNVDIVSTGAPTYKIDNTTYIGSGKTVLSSIDDDVEITVTTNEQLFPTVTGATLYDKDGGTLTRDDVISGKALKFAVVPDAGKKIKSVKYAIGQDTTSPVDLTGKEDADGFYTTAAVTDGLTLVVETEAQTPIYKAYLATGSDLGTACKLLDGQVITGTSGTEITGAGVEKVEKGVPYFFTVHRGSNEDIASVVVKSGDTESVATEISATKIKDNGENAIYKTASVSKNVFILVKTCAAYKIRKPANAKVTVDFASKADENGDITVPSANDFYFTVSPVSDNVIIDAVQRVKGSNTAAVANTKGNEYKIPAADIDYNMTIKVTTHELIAENDGYTVEWKVAGDVYSKGAYEHPMLVTEYTDATKKTIKSQKLNLVYKEDTFATSPGTGYVTAEFTSTAKGATPAGLGIANDGFTELVTVAGSTTTYNADALAPATYKKNGKDATDDVLTINANTTATTHVVGNNIGTDSILAQVLVTEGDNIKVYRAELPVEVTPAYKDVKVFATRDEYNATTNTTEIASITSSAADFNFSTLSSGDVSNLATFTLVGTNVRTGVTDAIGVSLYGTNIGAWKFNPYQPNKNPLTASIDDNYNNLDLTENTTIHAESATNKNTVYVASKAAENLTVEVPVKLNGAKEATTYSASVEVVEQKNYVTYSTVALTNGAKTMGINGGTYALEADTSSSAINGGTINLDVYEDLDGGTDIDDHDGTKLKKALKDGKVVKATATYTYSVANSPSTDKTEYISVKNEGNGKFTVTAKKKNSAASTLTVNAFVSGVLVATKTYAFNVTDAFAKGSVYLKLDNADDKDDSYKTTTNPTGIKQQKITAKYYTDKKNSIVEDTHVATLPNINLRGIKFTGETVGTKFKLPTQADFDQSRIGTGFVLVAWQDGATPTTYHYPGEEVAVAASSTYTAVWAPLYGWASSAAATTISGEVGNGLVIFNGNTKETVGDVDYYNKFVSVTSESPSVTYNGGQLTIGGSVPVVLLVNKRHALEETLTSVSSLTDLLDDSEVSDPEWKTSGITLASTDDPSGYVVDLSTAGTIKVQSDASGNTALVRATWTGSGVTLKTVPLKVTVADAPDYSLALADTEIFAEQVDDITAGFETLKTIKATLKNGGSTVSDGDADKLTWTWTSSDETVAELVDDSHENIKGIVAKKPGTTNINITVKNAGGQTASLANAAKLTVKPAGVTVTVYDEKDAVADKILAKVGSSAAATGYRVAVTQGTPSDVSFVTTSDRKTGDGLIIDATGSSIDASNKISIKVDEDDLSDKGEFYIYYTYGSKNFRKVVPVETYYGITVDAGASNIILKDGNEYKPAGSTVQKATAKATLANQKEVLDEDGDFDHYEYTNISLNGFTAKNASDAMAFKDWKGNGTDKYTNTIAGPLLSDAAGASGTLSGGNFTLTAEYEEAPLEVTIASNYVYLENSGATGSKNHEDLEFTVSPAASTTDLFVVPDTINFFKATAKDLSGSAMTDATVTGNFKLVRGTLNPRKDTMTLTAITGGVGVSRSGVATLSIRQGSVTGTEVSKIYLYVDGYDKEEKVYYESGNLVKNDARTIGTKSYYFDSEGKIVEGTKIITKADGKKILIIAGEIAGKGKRTAKIDDVTTTYYVGENGEILTGWITSAGAKATSAADGVYYADPETGAVAFDTVISDGGKHYLMNTSGTKVVGTGTGSIVTYNSKEYFIDKDGVVTVAGLATVDGKQYLFREDGTKVKHTDTDVVDGKIAVPKIGGPVYVIDDDDTAEQDDKKLVQNVSAFTWTPAKNKDYNHNTSVVKATVTVTFKMEKAGTPGSDTLEATVTKDSSASVSGKDVYKATVTATGYYTKDGKSDYDFSKVTDSKTYTYDPSSGQGKGEGLEISGIEASYEYTGKAIKPEPIVTDAATGEVLVKNTDYSVTYGKNKEPGENAGSVTVKGKGNYGADKNATVVQFFEIVDPRKDEDVANYFTIKSVKVTSKDNFTYDGTEKNPAELTIKTSEGDVKATWDGSSYNLNVDSKEMHINVSNNVNKGSGLVAVTGNNGKGTWVTKTATFQIKACDLSAAGDNLNIDASAEAWAVKGAKAKVEVTFMSETLVEGRDYTLAWSYTNRKNVGEKAGKVTVKGKGNFTKKAEQTFDITPFQIKKVNSVVAYAGLKKSGIKVTMYDGQGVVIPAKNYSVETKVFSKTGLEISDAKYKLEAGDKINVTVKAANSNLDGEETTGDIVVGANLAKAKITVPKSFTKTFTGEEIKLDAEDFGSGKISVGGYTYEEDFVITGYQNNVKKGTMTVFIQGVGDKVSGVSKFKVKIVPKKITPEN